MLEDQNQSSTDTFLSFDNSSNSLDSDLYQSVEDLSPELSQELEKSTYQGDYKNGLKHGEGVFTDTNGGTFTGEFIDGALHKGTYVGTEFTYSGIFKDGLKSEGVETYPDGSQNVGEYKDSFWYGQGAYTSSEGDTYVGIYENGLCDGQGVFKFSDGTQFVGKFSKGGFVEGKLTLPNGTVQEGKFQDGKFLG